jgi:hypothetical protein
VLLLSASVELILSWLKSLQLQAWVTVRPRALTFL